MTDLTLHLAILFISVFISACSQIMLKKAALKTYSSLLSEYLNFLVVTAYAIYFVAVILDLIALRQVPISYVPIVEASSYVFVLILSRIFLRERLSKRKILAIAIIFSGIAIYLF